MLKKIMCAILAAAMLLAAATPVFATKNGEVNTSTTPTATTAVTETTAEEAIIRAANAAAAEIVDYATVRGFVAEARTWNSADPMWVAVDIHLGTYKDVFLVGGNNPASYYLVRGNDPTGFPKTTRTGVAKWIDDLAALSDTQKQRAAVSYMIDYAAERGLYARMVDQTQQQDGRHLCAFSVSSELNVQVVIANNQLYWFRGAEQTARTTAEVKALIDEVAKLSPLDKAKLAAEEMINAASISNASYYQWPKDNGVDGWYWYGINVGSVTVLVGGNGSQEPLWFRSDGTEMCPMTASDVLNLLRGAAAQI